MYECWNLPLTKLTTNHSNLYIVHLNGARIIHSPMTKPIAINNGSPITNMTNQLIIETHEVVGLLVI